MPNNNYQLFKKEFKELSKIVNEFPENLQINVFEILLKELTSKNIDIKSTMPKLQVPKVNTKNEIPGIAVLNEKGEFKITIRDLKAESKADAVKRLVYIIIKAFLILNSNETKVSRKDVINKVLKEWRLNYGYARDFLANDKGIIRDGNLFNLDQHANKEADIYFNDILDEKKSGSWKPNSSTTRSKKQKTLTKNK